MPALQGRRRHRRGLDELGRVTFAAPKVDELFHRTALSLGMIVAHPPTDELWGVREFHLRHPDGTRSVSAPDWAKTDLSFRSERAWLRRPLVGRAALLRYTSRTEQTGEFICVL